MSAEDTNMLCVDQAANCSAMEHEITNLKQETENLPAEEIENDYDKSAVSDEQNPSLGFGTNAQAVECMDTLHSLIFNAGSWYLKHNFCYQNEIVSETNNDYIEETVEFIYDSDDDNMDTKEKMSETLLTEDACSSILLSDESYDTSIENLSNVEVQSIETYIVNIAEDEGEENVQPIRSSQNAKKVIKWTVAEEDKIVNYLLFHQNIELPTAEIYYKKMRQETKLDASWLLLKYKVNQLKNLFNKTKMWQNSFDAKCMNQAKIEENTLKMCPFFYSLNLIFSHVPKKKSFKVNSSYAVINEETFSNGNNLSESYKPVADFNVNDLAMLGKSKEDDSNADTKVQLKRLEIDMMQYEFEKYKFNKEFELENKKLILEERKMEHEFALKKIALEEEIKIKKLELEHRKHKAIYELELKYRCKNTKLEMNGK